MQKNKTIVIVLSSLQGGGAERVAVDIAEFLSTNDYTVHLITLSGADIDVYKIPQGVHRHSLNLYFNSASALKAVWSNLKRVRELRKKLKELKPDVVLSFLVEVNVTTVLAAFGMRLRTVVAERNYAPKEETPRYWQILRRHCYRLASVVVTQTSKGEQWLQQNTSAKVISVVPNHARWPILKTSPVKKPQSLVGEYPFVLAVGRVHPQKGFDHLVEQFSKLPKETDEWRCVIAGAESDSKYSAALKDQIERLNLSSRVMMIGSVGNLGDWYSACDLFVLSSRYEGFPNALLEAMASGVAVISMDCDTGPRDIIKNDVNGMLVSEDSESNQLSDAIAALATNPQRREELATQSVIVREQFSQAKVMVKWIDVLEQA